MSGPGALRRLLAAAGRRLMPDPVEFGVFEFIGQTIGRSLKHRLFLATYGGFGAAMVIIMRANGGDALRVPLLLSFVLVSGLRAAFNFPSDLRANWAFQVSETAPVRAYVRATRQWMLLYAVVPLFAATAIVESFSWPWTSVLFHFAFGTATSLVLLDVLFLDFHKVPFTCSHLPGKVNLVFLVVIYFFGFTFYSGYLAALEERLSRAPLVAVLFLVAVAALVPALGIARRRLLSIETGLEYEDDGDPTVRTLDLTASL